MEYSRKGRKESHFTQIDNISLSIEKAIIKNEDGSVRELLMNLEHIGFITYIQSLPEGWVLSMSHLLKIFSIGKEKYYRIVKDLKTLGFIADVDHIDNMDREEGSGRFKKSKGLVWYDQPIALQKNVVLKIREGHQNKFSPLHLSNIVDGFYLISPCTEKPHAGEPHAGEQHTINKEFSINKDFNKQCVGSFQEFGGLLTQGTAETNSVKTPIETRDAAARGRAAHELFEIFWDVYKRKVQKNHAMKSWMKLTQDEMNVCISAAREYCRDREERYIMYPKKFISEKWFNEPIASVSSKPAKKSEPSIPSYYSKMPILR